METKVMFITIMALLCISAVACGKQPELQTTMLATETAATETTEPPTEMETDAVVDPRIRDIVGVWFEDGEQALDPRILTIQADGTYILDYKGGGSADGTIVVETEEHPDGTETVWYSFYESDGNLWTGFQRTAEQPQNDLYSGHDGEQHFQRATSVNAPETTESTDAVTTVANSSTTVAAKTTAAAAQTTKSEAKSTAVTAPTMPQEPTNTYGFYPITEVPQTSVSVKQFHGSWENADKSGEEIHFYDCDFLIGCFSITKPDDTIDTIVWGMVKLEGRKNADGTETCYYNLYANQDNKLLFSIGTNTGIPFEEFTTTNGRRYIRKPETVIEHHSPEEFLGDWSVGRAYLDVTKSGNVYNVHIQWSSSAAEYDYWDYACSFENNMLVCNGVGRHTRSIYSADGTETQTLPSDKASAQFRILNNGCLAFDDLDEHCADDTEFMR